MYFIKKIVLSCVLLVSTSIMLGMKRDNKLSKNRVFRANLHVTTNQECPYAKYECLYAGIKNDLFRNGNICADGDHRCDKFSQSLVDLRLTLKSDFCFMSTNWIEDEIYDFFVSVKVKYRDFLEKVGEFVEEVSEYSDLYKIGMDLVKDKEVVLHPSQDIAFLKVNGFLCQIDSTDENLSEFLNLKKEIESSLDNRFSALIDYLDKNNSYMFLASLLVEESETTGKKMMSTGFSVPQD